MFVGTRLSSLLSEFTIAEFQLGINEWRILSVVERSPNCTIGEICAEVGIHKTIVSRALKALEEKELLKAVREKRAVRIFVTERGETTLTRCRPALRRLEESFFQGLPPEQIASMLALILRIAKNAGAIRGGVSEK